MGENSNLLVSRRVVESALSVQLPRVVRVVWACALTAGQCTSSSVDGRVLILAGMVADLALTMEGGRQAMTFMPVDVMSVGDRSGQVGEVEGIHWSKDRATPSGVRQVGAYECRCELWDVQSQRAEETAKIEARADFDRRHPSVLQPGIWWLLERLHKLPQECGPPPVLFRGGGSWSVLGTVGDTAHEQVWEEADRFREVGLGELLSPPSMTVELSLLPGGRR